MNFNKEFYPTTSKLISKMLSKVDWSNANHVCDPSAGSGSILNQIRETQKRYRRSKLYAIEKDDNLRNMLIGSGERVIGKDFLTYSGLIQFDTIIMNPPFSNGDEHLLKAIDILYSGQIICLLNAETIKNPYSNKRKDLKRKLSDLNADIEFIKDGFMDAERKTKVEVALVTIKIERSIEDDLLSGANDQAKEYIHEKIDHEIKDVAQRDSIEAIVDDYNFRVNLGIKLIHKHFVDSKYVGSYFQLGIVDAGDEDTGSIQSKTNLFLEQIRNDYWEKVLSLPDFEKRLTEKKRKEFRETIQNNSYLEFTSANVRAFFENLMASYESILIDAAEDLFDTMTWKYAFDESIHNKNVHYYNGWKTNDAFKVNKKVVLLGVGTNPYRSWSANDVDYESKRKLDDIDKVMNYFEGKSDYRKITDAVDEYSDIFQVLESEFFKIRFYKKGTTHLTFKSEDIRRRFNIEVGRRKGWLPQDYGTKPIKELSLEDEMIAVSFEDDIKDYDKGIASIGLANNDLLMIAG